MLDCKIITDRTTGKSKGYAAPLSPDFEPTSARRSNTSLCACLASYGFVTFQDAETAEAVKKSTDLFFLGKMVRRRAAHTPRTDAPRHRGTRCRVVRVPTSHRALVLQMNVGDAYRKTPETSSTPKRSSSTATQTPPHEPANQSPPFSPVGTPCSLALPRAPRLLLAARASQLATTTTTRARALAPRAPKIVGCDLTQHRPSCHRRSFALLSTHPSD